jgi:hypothetical protein
MLTWSPCWSGSSEMVTAHSDTVPPSKFGNETSHSSLKYTINRMKKSDKDDHGNKEER